MMKIIQSFVVIAILTSSLVCGMDAVMEEDIKIETAITVVKKALQKEPPVPVKELTAYLRVNKNLSISQIETVYAQSDIAELVAANEAATDLPRSRQKSITTMFDIETPKIQTIYHNIKKDVLRALVDVKLEDIPVFKPEKVELDLLHDKMMAGGVVQAPAFPDMQTIFKIDGLKNAKAKCYNGCMGRVTGINAEDNKRWNMEIVMNGKRKILAIGLGCLKPTDANEAREAEDTLDTLIIGDTVRYQVKGDKDFHIGQITESETLSEKDTEFFIKPFNGGESILKSTADLTKVTPAQLQAMDRIKEVTHELTGNIEGYMGSLKSGATANLLDAMFSQMKTILKMYKRPEYNIIGWRGDEMMRKLQEKMTAMEVEHQDNKNQAYAQFARVAYKMLESSMSYTRARQVIEDEDKC